MESTVWSALVLLCVGHTLCRVLDFQQARQPPCFVSCSCDSSGLITCNASPEFELQVVLFNEFLHRQNASSNSRVHIHTLEKNLPIILPQMPVLRHLSLAENIITEVQSGVLHGMRLQELNLSHNLIVKIHPEAFQDLQQLKLLDLSHNSLTSVSKLVFSDLPSLEVLNLDFNQLLYFPLDAFSRVPHLQKLTLNENRLSYLMPGNLVSLTAVHVLSLRNNKLQSFVVDLMDEVPNLSVLDVSGNPFHCGCALIGLRAVLNSSVVMVKEMNKISCLTPSTRRHDILISNTITTDFSNCTAPEVVHTLDTHNVWYTADVEITCDFHGDPDPAVLWVTPWGHHFADPSHWSQLEKECLSCKQQRRYKGIGIGVVSTVSVLSHGKKLLITNFRSFFNGNITCHAYNLHGNATAVHEVRVHTGLVSISVHNSMIMGGMCAAAALCLGMLIGTIKVVVLACRKRFGKKKEVALTPSLEEGSFEEKQSMTDESHCRDDSVDISDDFYPPETPFTTPQAVSPTSPRKVHTPPEHEGGMDTPPGGWLPSNILDTMEEVRWRLRYGVGRRMHAVKRNVQHIKESGMRNVQSIRESGSVYVHNIMESGSTAANKVKAGVVMGVETVKYHVQSIKEFCGTGDMGTQTISMISVETNLDTNETREVVKSVTFV